MRFFSLGEKWGESEMKLNGRDRRQKKIDLNPLSQKVNANTSNDTSDRENLIEI